jgi:hypothetical protein
MKRNLITLLTHTVKRVPSSGSTNSHQTVADGSPVPETDRNEVGPKPENLEPEDCLSIKSLLKPSLMICKAANTCLDSGKEFYVDSKLEESSR